MKTRPADDVAAIRSFNRYYTERMALLDETLLDSAFTLAQARVLYELGTRTSPSAGDLVESLGLDPGYLSRILQGFRQRGLVARRRARDDGRRVELSLTARGRRQFSALDRKSRRSIAQLIRPLSASARDRVLESMRTIESTLTPAVPAAAGTAPAAPKAGAPRRVLIRPHRIGDIGWAIERHGTLYAEEFGWNGEFEGFVAGILGRFACAHEPAHEGCWIAESGGERLGCVFVVRNEKDPGAAQLRCLLVDPRGRGLGIGRRLVEQCLTFAKSAGYAKMVLWTNDVLVSARRIYEAAGFALIEESSHHSFGRDLTGQVWSKDL